MGYDRHFKGTIWTNHALERLKQRGISQGDAWATWRRPNQSRYASTKDAWVFYRTWSNETIEVVAKQNEKKEWVILSVWSRPVNRKHRAKAKESWLMRLVKKI